MLSTATKSKQLASKKRHFWRRTAMYFPLQQQRMGNRASGASPQKGAIKAPGYLASVLPFLEPGDGIRELEAYLRANPGSQRMVAEAMANQSVDPQFRRNVVSLGGLRILRLLLTSQEHDVLLCAAHALGNLAVDSASHVQMAQKGCFHELMDLLSCGKVDLQCKAARAVTNLCVGDDNKHMFDELGAVGALMALAKHPNVTCRTEAIAALGNLAVDDTLELKIARHGGIEAVMPCVDMAGAPGVLRQHAARALKNLTTADENKEHYDALQPGQREPQAASLPGESGFNYVDGGGGETENHGGFDHGGYNNSSNGMHRTTPSTIQSILHQAVDTQSSPRTSGEFQTYGRETSGSTYGVGRKTMDEYAEAAARRAAAEQASQAVAAATAASSSSSRATFIALDAKEEGTQFPGQNRNSAGASAAPVLARAPVAAASSPSASAPPPPSVWNKILDPATNHYYWYNTQTKESSWTPPMAPVPPTQPRPQPLPGLVLQPDPASLLPVAGSPLSPTSAMKRGHGRKATQQVDGDLKGASKLKRRTSKGAGRRGTVIVQPEASAAISKGQGRRGSLLPQKNSEAESDDNLVQSSPPSETQLQSSPAPQRQQQQQQSPPKPSIRKGTLASAVELGLPVPTASQSVSTLISGASAAPAQELPMAVNASTPSHKGRTHTMIDAMHTQLPPDLHATAVSVPLPPSSPAKMTNMTPSGKPVAAPPTDDLAPPSIPLPQVPPPTTTNAGERKNKAVAPPRVPDGEAPHTFSTERKASDSIMLPPEPHPHDTLSAAEKQVVEAINCARKNPAKFAERLMQMKERLGADNVLRFDWG